MNPTNDIEVMPAPAAKGSLLAAAAATVRAAPGRLSRSAWFGRASAFAFTCPEPAFTISNRLLGPQFRNERKVIASVTEVREFSDGVCLGNGQFVKVGQGESSLIKVNQSKSR